MIDSDEVSAMDGTIFEHTILGSKDPPTYTTANDAKKKTMKGMKYLSHQNLIKRKTS